MWFILIGQLDDIVHVFKVKTCPKHFSLASEFASNVIVFASCRNLGFRLIECKVARRCRNHVPV